MRGNERTKLAGIVPLGAAVQQSNYSVAAKKRAWNTHRSPELPPAVITPEDQAIINPREHLKIAQEQLKLNSLFWAMRPTEAFEEVKQMLAAPDLAGDPAGGLVSALPPKTFLK